MKTIKWMILILTLFKLAASNPAILKVFDISGLDRPAENVFDLLHESSEYKENLEKVRNNIQNFAAASKIIKNIEIRKVLNVIKLFKKFSIIFKLKNLFTRVLHNLKSFGVKPESKGYKATYAL